MTAVVLPPLRDELGLHPGPVGADGAPSWTLHDPLRNQFFRLGWPAFEILSRWSLGDPDAIAAAVSAETTLELGAEEVLEVVKFLAHGQLLRGGSPEQTRRLLAIADAHKVSWATWLLHHYLFFRIPLVRPDRRLAAALPWVAWLGSPAFRWATLAALAVGLFLAGRQWEVFGATLVDRLSLPGLAAFGVALTFAKILHELGHAFTAKRFDRRVPTMGMAFLVMLPMLYTDVSEAWLLPDRRRRLLVGGAGILCELSLAAWATLAWGLLPDGPARAMAFTLATTTWISSLAINLSPFMRFDGYFLVMDALDTPNLHSRSFALARWWLREMLFDLDEPCPEYLPPLRRAGLIAFAIAVWVYRLVVFLGIALLVYHFFIKVLGVVLFGIEMGWFVLRPFAMELTEWRLRAGAIAVSRRGKLSFGLFGLAVLAMVVPWSGRVRAPAMLKAAEHVVVYAPAPARLIGIAVGEGQAVKSGDVLVRLDDPDAAYRLTQADRHVEAARYELASVDFEPSFRDKAPVIARQLDTALADAAATSAALARNSLTAPFDGVVTDVATDLAPGDWTGVREPLLAVRSTSGAVIDAYVAETDLERIAAGTTAHFLRDGGFASQEARVTDIGTTAIRALPDPALANLFGGPLSARAVKQSIIPDSAVFRVRLVLTTPLAVPNSLRGQVVIDGQPESLAAHAWRTAAAVVRREWGS